MHYFSLSVGTILVTGYVGKGLKSSLVRTGVHTCLVFCVTYVQTHPTANIIEPTS